jgi:hypothetical protein
MVIGSHIRVTLVQDTVHYAIIRGAENLINLVKFDVVNKKLTLSNDNKCNFLRNYKKKNIHVFLHFKTLSNIEFDGSETLDSEGQLAVNTLTFFVKDGAASINLNLDIDYLFASIGKGYSYLNFSGNANYASFKITGNSYANTNELFIRDSIDFVSNTAVPCRVNINGAKAQIQTENSGDVIYRGVPISLKENKYGTGLIQPE